MENIINLKLNIMAGRPKNKPIEEVEDQAETEAVIYVPEKSPIQKVVESLRENLTDLETIKQDYRGQGRSITRLVYASREITAVVKYLTELI